MLLIRARMHYLLHSTTSCHFKICLKTESHYWDNGSSRPYCDVFGHSFIWRLVCGRWNEGSLYNSLPFSGEAHGTGGLSVISLLQILEQCDLSDFDICFVQIGENDVKTAKDDQLGLNNH